MQEVCEFLKTCKYYFLATVDGNTPQARPMGTAHIIDGKLCFMTASNKAVAQQILANPRVSLVAYDGEIWVRINALAITDDRVTSQEAMLDAYPALRKLYTAGDGISLVLAISDATATFSDNRVITF